MNNFKYIKNFDGLRAFAVFFVLLIHGSYGYFKGGWIGVDLFFVLSGYLITTLLQKDYIKNNKISILKFYIRRIFRLLPALVLCIFLSNILNLVSVNPKVTGNLFASLATLFYFNNFIDINILGNLTHLWSLSVEEHFYLIWPLCLSYLFLRYPKKNQITFIILIIIFIMIVKIISLQNYFVYSNGVIVIDTHRFTFFRIDSLLIGSLASLLASDLNYKTIFENKIKCNSILILIGAIFFYFLFKLGINDAFYKNGGFLLINLLCAILILITANIPENFLLSNKLISWVGVRSYGIYIYHFSIFIIFEDIRISSSIYNFLLVTFLRLAATLIVAEISYTFMEKPLLNLKKRFSVN